MLDATYEQIDKNVDARENLEQREIKESTDGSLATLIGRSIMHNSTPAEDDGIEDDCQYNESGRHAE